MVLLLKEYLSSSDMKEATRCLQELEVPHFHHELVYEVKLTLLLSSTKIYRQLQEMDMLLIDMFIH